MSMLDYDFNINLILFFKKIFTVQSFLKKVQHRLFNFHLKNIILPNPNIKNHVVLKICIYIKL